MADATEKAYYIDEDVGEDIENQDGTPELPVSRLAPAIPSYYPLRATPSALNQVYIFPDGAEFL
jgi:hypothetical protein